MIPIERGIEASRYDGRHETQDRNPEQPPRTLAG